MALLVALGCASAFAEGTMLVDEPVTLNVAVCGSNYCLIPWNDKQFYKDLAAETGVTLNFEEMNDWTQQINLKIAGDELPDVLMYKHDGVSNNLDYFYDLTDLIPIYAPSLQKLFEEEPSVKASVTEANGRIYKLPTQHTLMEDNMLSYFMCINQRWLDNVGMENPTTLDELYAVLKAFKEQDANGNGDPNDEVPFGFAENKWDAKIQDLFGSFGVLNNIWSGYTEVNDDNQIIFQPAQSGYYEALCFLHKLSAEGLLDTEGFTQAGDQYTARLNQDTYGVVIGWDYTGSDLGFVAMNPIIGKNGECIIGGTSLSSASNYISLSADCKNPEALLKLYEYVNASMSLKLSNRYGEEGVSWKHAETGDPDDFIMLAEVEPIPEGYEFWNQYVYTIGESGENGLMFFSMNDWKHNVSQKNTREQAVAMYRPYFPKNNYKYVSLSEELNNELALLETEVKAYCQAFYASAVMDGIDEAGWEKHLDTLKSLGIDRYLELKQMSYDAFLTMTK